MATSKTSTSRKSRRAAHEARKNESKGNQVTQALQQAGIVSNTGVSTARIEGAQVNIEELTQRPPLLSCPIDYIDELAKLNPYWAAVAMRVLCSTVGWYAVNTVLWDYRKENAKPKVTSDIDFMNNMLADVQAREHDEVVQQAQGLRKLAFVNGKTLIGGYKYLFGQVAASQIDVGNMDMPSPSMIYARMQQARDERQVTEAYEKFEAIQYKDNPNIPYIKARAEQRQKQLARIQENRGQREIDHIHTVLRDAPLEVFGDGVWARVPMWAQFKMNRSLHKQVISAIVNEDEKESHERIHKEELMKLGETILLELQAADREPEVRLAFDTDVLKEQHALVA